MRKLVNLDLSESVVNWKQAGQSALEKKLSISHREGTDTGTVKGPWADKIVSHHEQKKHKDP